jgi:hypothetical protein
MHIGHDPDVQVLALFDLSRPLKAPLVVMARYAYMTVSYISLFRCLCRRFKTFAPVLDTDAMLHDDGAAAHACPSVSCVEFVASDKGISLFRSGLKQCMDTLFLLVARDRMWCLTFSADKVGCGRHQQAMDSYSGAR